VFDVKVQVWVWVRGPDIGPGVGGSAVWPGLGLGVGPGVGQGLGPGVG
jgi:hypothetical protein